MSYCRWSTNNFHCDLYCYEDVSGGYTTHVAGNRVIGEVPDADGAMEKFLAVIEEKKKLASPSGMVDHEAIKQWLENDPECKRAAEDWGTMYRAQMDMLRNAQRLPIGLPHDGERFNDDTLELFRERLLMLRKAGYQFPDSVLETIEREILNGEEEKE